MRKKQSTVWVDDEVKRYTRESLAFTGMSKWIKKLTRLGLLMEAQTDNRLWSSLEFALEGEDSSLLYNVLHRMDAQGLLDMVWDSPYEMAIRRTLTQLGNDVKKTYRNASLRRAVVRLAYKSLQQERGMW